jgi:conjugative relaxase-like TrwC/TraI family protein
LVLAAAGLKAGQEDYWIRQIAASRCEYLSGHGESPGQWYGARAATLGLAGIAQDQQCRAMFEGKDPITGEQVAQPKWVADPRSKLLAGPLAERLRALADERSIPVGELAGSQVLAAEVRAVLSRREVKAETIERVSRHVLGADPQEVYGDAYAEAAKHAGRRVDDRDACFDLCFSDVKSGSLFYAGADEATRREYVAARQEAIRGALGWLEQHAVGVRRGHGGSEHLDGRGLLAIGYDHRTSREGDPQLHTHMLAQNLTEGPDGRATALDSKRLWAHLMTAERVYQQLWRAELSQRLGLEFVEVADHEQLEIKGWEDKALRDGFSKRAAQVKAQCDAWGTSDTRTAREAARATRRAKDHSETEDVIYDRWRAELAEHGVTERTYAERLGRATGHALTEDQTAALLGELAGPEGLTAQASTFARRDVVDQLARRLPVGTSASTTLRELEVLADRFLSERAVVVARDEQLAEVRYSTPELVALEERMLDGATARADAGCAVVAPEHLRATLEAFPMMAQDQADALADLTRSGAGVSLLVGKAGYGKTFVAGAAAHTYGLQGHRLIGTAPTGLAATGLASEGFTDARTVDRLLGDLEQRRDRLDAKTVLLVDEAGMVGTRKLARLLEEANQAEAKVILIGDDRQLSSIDAGGGFRGLRLRLGASELTQNRRQQAKWEQQALELVRRFEVEQAVSLYREHDRVVLAETRDELTRGLLEDWRQAFRDGQDVVILAHRRQDVGRFNLACQQLRADAGELNPDPEQRLHVGDRRFAVGDRVVCGKNALKQLGVANGTRGTVVALDREARSLTIQIGDNADAKSRGATEGERVTLPASYLDGKGRPGAPRRVDLAYATTGHKSQGLTKWTSLPFVSGREDAQWLYVVLSRAKHLTRIYTVTGPEERPPELSEVPDTRRAPDGYQRLAAVMGRDRAEQLATDARRLVYLRAMPTRQLRAERDRLDAAMDQAPRDRRHEAERATKRHAEREQRVRELKAAGVEGPELATAIKLADQAGEQAHQLRRHQQQRAAWLETNAEFVAQRRAVMGELGWRHRADARAIELDPPADLVAAFGPMPTERRAQADWRAAVSQVDGYRRAWGIDPPGSAKHEAWSEREEERKEHAGTTPVEDRQASPTSKRSRPERRPARTERRAVRAEELLGPQPTRDPSPAARLAGSPDHLRAVPRADPQPRRPRAGGRLKACPTLTMRACLRRVSSWQAGGPAAGSWSGG